MSKNNNCESRKQFSKIDDITETKYGPVFLLYLFDVVTALSYVKTLILMMYEPKKIT